MARFRIGFWQRVVVMMVVSITTPLTRKTWLRTDDVPATGPVILVPNHVSHFDPLVVAHYVYGTGRWPRFLGKASVWKVPIIGFLLVKARQIPVERGSVDAVKSLDTLVDALREGGAVVIYPEGTTTRHPDLWPMRGKTGAARLALLTGAPVVPIANWGAQAIFDPRTNRLKLRRSPVTVTTGRPVDLSRWAGLEPTRQVLAEMTEAIMLNVRDLLGEIRDGEPPALYDRPVNRAITSEEAP
ncbi:lysophospholipid acyltransferase family protein [Actinoplanes derwentensis]|uniref:1-acyl-sn-glycerol-3-phosphate acyltransferases n=1 Tax=Actinoplanes derwentensis TaxID=113562 RepID=A0A1H2D442_9ACTN|nr:lysophospholipid acyltransferase family protein [Actinoplanes derwentensis]GID87978.1 1-acyl-sn-glycerol-3-phosphate acyltransferase [Actinoplanes derwentensis]SDT77538.1 1-acyl-sn-glycerol-3-phosphate acyltransferases [Actinoplanes derwentensis]